MFCDKIKYMEPISQNTAPIVGPTPTPISKPKYWKRRLLASVGVFVLCMGYFAYGAQIIEGGFTAALLVGSLVIALGVSFIFYFIYWIISIIGRRLGKVYAIIIWALLLVGLIAWGFLLIQGRVANSNTLLSNEESIVLPPGTNLSELPSYIQIDKSKIRNIPGGGMVIPKSAIKFVMTYDECLKTTDVGAEQGCANKYSLERKDVDLCKSMIHSDNPDRGESTATLQQECVAQYAVVNMQASLCNSLENIFIGSACFEGIINQIDDSNQCRTVFKEDVDINDCVRMVTSKQ